MNDDLDRMGKQLQDYEKIFADELTLQTKKAGRERIRNTFFKAGADKKLLHFLLYTYIITQIAGKQDFCTLTRVPKPV